MGNIYPTDEVQIVLTDLDLRRYFQTVLTWISSIFLAF